MLLDNSGMDKSIKAKWDRQCILEQGVESLVKQDQQSRRAERVLVLISLLTVLFVVAEVIGGYLAHSLAIMTDAFHMLSDLSSFLVSILAIHLSRRPSTTRHSFGFYRAEVLGALSSILVIWVLTGVLLYLAVWRIVEQEYEVEPDTMMVTAGIGVLFNLLVGGMLHLVCHAAGPSVLPSHGHSHGGISPKESVAADPENGSLGSLNSSAPAQPEQNLNIRAAFVHVLGDLVQSLGVLIAALVIKFTGFALADPICTFLFSVLVLLTTVPVFGDTLAVLMEASPHSVDHQRLFSDLISLPGVIGVHSLRVWALKTDVFAATVHLELVNCSADKIVAMAQRKMALGHRIRFATVQTQCLLQEEETGRRTGGEDGRMAGQTDQRQNGAGE